MRLVSAAVLLFVILVTLWVLKLAVTILLVGVVAFLAARELAGIANTLGAGVPAFFLGAISALVSVAFLVSTQGTSPEGLAVVLFALVLSSGALTLAQGVVDPSALMRASVIIMVPLYIGLPLGVFTWVQSAHGPAATTWLLAIIAVSDSAQYYCGRTFGRRKLAPAVSPAKTVEGAVGGVIVAALVGALTAPWCVPGVSPLGAFALTLALALAGILGDLFESLIKRSAGVKDSSNLIPGHGGVLDRIDSHLFAAPVFFVFLRYFA